MHTPAHVVVNLAVLGRSSSTAYILPVLVGSLVPDVPMFIFYIVEKFILGTPNIVIWREAYFQPGWQAFIDTFNSIPFVLIGLFIAWRQKQVFFVLMFSSMLLHIGFDLPFHHDDGHRHFFPFLDWRFASPISYWDPGHFGRIFAVIEALLVLACCWLIYLRHQYRWTRVSAAVVAGFQVFDYGLGYRFYL